MLLKPNFILFSLLCLQLIFASGQEICTRVWQRWCPLGCSFPRWPRSRRSIQKILEYLGPWKELWSKSGLRRKIRNTGVQSSLQTKKTRCHSQQPIRVRSIQNKQIQVYLKPNFGVYILNNYNQGGPNGFRCYEEKAYNQTSKNKRFHPFSYFPIKYSFIFH